ncbi:MAG TPA: hypothetical protein VGJ83_05020 [Gemmatimonadales bacterium]|jgi:hypothetical protein
MLRKYAILLAAAALAGLAAGGCSNGPSDPNPPEMPMQVVAADSLSR